MRLSELRQLEITFSDILMPIKVKIDGRFIPLR